RGGRGGGRYASWRSDLHSRVSRRVRRRRKRRARGLRRPGPARNASQGTVTIIWLRDHIYFRAGVPVPPHSGGTGMKRVWIVLALAGVCLAGAGCGGPRQRPAGALAVTPEAVVLI